MVQRLIHTACVYQQYLWIWDCCMGAWRLGASEAALNRESGREQSCVMDSFTLSSVSHQSKPPHRLHTSSLATYYLICGLYTSLLLATSRHIDNSIQMVWYGSILTRHRRCEIADCHCSPVGTRSGGPFLSGCRIVSPIEKRGITSIDSFSYLDLTLHPKISVHTKVDRAEARHRGRLEWQKAENEEVCARAAPSTKRLRCRRKGEAGGKAEGNANNAWRWRCRATP
jgi:hypothetical protein